MAVKYGAQGAERVYYTEKEDLRLRGALRAGLPLEDVARLVGRTPWSVAARAKRLGLGWGWVQEARKKESRARREEGRLRDRVPLDREKAHFRLTVVYRSPVAEITERVFCRDQSELQAALASMPPAMMGGALSYYSAARREDCGGGHRRWVNYEPQQVAA